jgi:hypothetical protein
MSVSEFPAEVEVFMEADLDDSGRQTWNFKLVEGSEDLYFIYTEAGTTP